MELDQDISAAEDPDQATPLKQRLGEVFEVENALYGDISISLKIHAPNQGLVVFTIEDGFRGKTLADIEAVARTQMNIGELVEVIQLNRASDGIRVVKISVLVFGSVFGDIDERMDAYLEEMIAKLRADAPSPTATSTSEDK